MPRDDKARQAMIAGAAATILKKEKAAQRRKSSNPDKGENIMGAIFGIFPLLAIPVIIYNLMAFVFAGKPPEPVQGVEQVSPMLANLNNALINVPMIGGVMWQVTSGDALVLLGMILLFAEILKSTSTGTATILNHAVSMIIFIVCLVEFLLFPQFATSVFFLLMMMALLDVLAGVMVTIVSARRDFAVGEGFNN
jgi:hypothetical protein